MDRLVDLDDREVSDRDSDDQQPVLGAERGLMCISQAGCICIFGPMSHGPQTNDSESMPMFAPSRNRTDAVSNLYDSACDLLFAAQQMRSTAARPGAAPAIAATVGCLDAGLEALVEAIQAMSRTAVRELEASGKDLSVTADVIEREFEALAEVVAAACVACDEMRGRIGPLMAQLTLT